MLAADRSRSELSETLVAGVDVYGSYQITHATRATQPDPLRYLRALLGD